MKNSFSKKPLLSILVLTAVIFNFSSCSTIATKGSLEPIEIKISLNKPVKIKYLAYTKYKDWEGHFYSANDNNELKDLLKTRFDEMKLITAEEYTPSIGNVYLSGKNRTEDLEKFIRPEFPIKADYLFIAEQILVRRNDGHLLGYWGLIHLASLGLIPMAFKHEINIRTALYDKNGKLIHEETASDSTTLWSWSPFIFSKESRFFKSSKELLLPKYKTVLDHAMTDVKLDVP